MKAALLLGVILLMSLVMANDQSKSEEKTESGAKVESQNRTGILTKSTGIMVSESPVFFLLPLMWMVIHLLHI